MEEHISHESAHGTSLSHLELELKEVTEDIKLQKRTQKPTNLEDKTCQTVDAFKGSSIRMTASQKYHKKLKDPENVERLYAYRERQRRNYKKHRAKMLMDEELANEYRRRKAIEQQAYRDRKANIQFKDGVKVMSPHRPPQTARRKSRCISCGVLRIKKSKKSSYVKKKIIVQYECKDCIRQRIESLGKMTCDLCDFQTRVRKKFNYHIESHINLKCDVCQMVFKSKNSLRAHLKRYFEHFICDKCGLTFSSPNNFRHHINLHNPDFVKKSRKQCTEQIGEFQCKFCPLLFNKKTTCLGHEDRLHKKCINPNPFQCKVCEKNLYQKEDLRLHSFEHFQGKLRFCDFPDCSKFFKNGKALTNHKRCHYPPKYTCLHCGKKFVDKSGVRKHIIQRRCELLKIKENKQRSEEEERQAAIARAQYDEFFGNVLTESKVDIIYDPDFKDGPELTTIKEEISDGGFTAVVVKVEPLDDWSNEYHNENVEPFINPHVLLERLEPEVILRWTKVKTEPQEVQAFQNLLGDQIKENESSEDYFSDHRENLNKKPRKLYEGKKRRTCGKRTAFEPGAKCVCDKCGKDFRNVYSIRRHLKNVHPAENFVCNACNIAFKTRGNYNRHCIRKHSSIKAFICHICARAFHTPYGLSGHIRNHDQPEECKICGKMIRNMKSHLERHKYKRTAEKAYVSCPQCGKLVNRYQLQAHIDSAHTKVFNGKIYHCDTCFQKFTRREDLRRHNVESHNQDKLFVCHCGQVFAKRKALTSHKVSHNPDNATCKFCGNVYVRKEGLRKHMRTKHRETMAQQSPFKANE